MHRGGGRAGRAAASGGAVKGSGINLRIIRGIVLNALQIRASAEGFSADGGHGRRDHHLVEGGAAVAEVNRQSCDGSGNGQ